MAKAKIQKNLNKIIKDATHRPQSSDGNVLYAKVPGYSGGSEGDRIDTEAEKSPAYKAASEHSYNSPTNIRRIFITGKEVVVQYYASMVVKNTQTVKKWHNVSFKSGDDLFQVASDILTYPEKMNQYIMEKTVDSKAVEPEGYTITGLGIRVASEPWVCSNLEEMYFDWTLLMSPDIARYFPPYLSDNNGIANLLNKTSQAQENVNDICSRLFADYNSSGIKDIRKRFPRLKSVGMISNLYDVLNHPSMIKIDNDFNNMEEAQQTWYSLNRNLIAQSNSIVYISDLSEGISKLNDVFVVKDNVYKFDFEKLKGEFEKYTTKIKDYKRQRMYGTSMGGEETSADAMADIDLIPAEQRFVEIEQQYGERILKNALIIATSGHEFNKSELHKIFQQFSKPNRKRMASMIGLQLDN